MFKDGQPIPDDELEQEAQDPKQQDHQRGDLTPVTRQSSTPTTSSPIITPTSSKSTLTNSAPTESHAIAEADHEEKGAAQEQHFEAEVKDLGWHEDPNDVPRPLVGGLYNENLWMLVRRFNKVKRRLFARRHKKLKDLANVSCQSNREYPNGGVGSQYR